MSFSIYGGYLRPGYCEVHPDTKGTYPCPDCDDEYWAEREQVRAYADQQADHDRELRAEYDRYLRTQWYRDGAREWLRCNQTGEELPQWWWQGERRCTA